MRRLRKGVRRVCEKIGRRGVLPGVQSESEKKLKRQNVDGYGKDLRRELYGRLQDLRRLQIRNSGRERQDGSACKKKKKDPYRKRSFSVRIFFRENFTLFPGIFAEGLKSAAICAMIVRKGKRRKTVGSDPVEVAGRPRRAIREGRRKICGNLRRFRF